MRIQRVKELLELLPAESPYITRIPHELSTRGVPREVDLHAYAENDPRFGWGFVSSCVALQRALPSTITEPELVRPYVHLAYELSDPEAQLAIGLELDRADHRRILLRCGLLLPQYSYSALAQRLGLSESAVRIFEALFWNVRDRLADRIYIASLVYPESRQVELLPGYYRNESRMFLALRATWKSGSLEAAEEFLGGKESNTQDPSLWSRELLSTMDLLLKVGLVHQSLHIFRQGLALLRSRRGKAGLKKQADPRVQPISLSAAVSMSFHRVHLTLGRPYDRRVRPCPEKAGPGQSFAEALTSGPADLMHFEAAQRVKRAPQQLTEACGQTRLDILGVPVPRECQSLSLSVSVSA
jgi:hypothetical protein